MKWKKQQCPHCNAEIIVGTCVCGMPFVLTQSHLEGRKRTFSDTAVSEMPDGAFKVNCDFCTAKELGVGLAGTTSAGLSQKTCPACHTECLSQQK